MDSSNLETVATYINNLLLARGLLRNGTPVDFQSLARTNESNDEQRSKSNALRVSTTVQVINVIHDLILRRDRDHLQIESLATAIAGFKADHKQGQLELAGAKERIAELSRKNSQLEQSERAASKATTSSDLAARQLREEVQKTKATLAQVRTQCNNDIRKRDIELQRLKQHLTTQQRGSAARNPNPVGPSCTIVAGFSSRTQMRKRDMAATNVEDATYSLKQETTEFLTDLSRGLSDENDALISLVKTSVETLRDLMGLPHNLSAPGGQDGQGTIPSPSQGWSQDEMRFAPPVTCRDLGQDMQAALNSLQELLANPSFAPIEDVHVREEEIKRLRQGWEQMEGRWHETVQMMTHWSRRMQNGGDSVNVAELKMGLQLNEGLRTLEQISPGAVHQKGNTKHLEVDGAEDGQESDQPPDTESPVARREQSAWVRTINRPGQQLAELNSNVQTQKRAGSRGVTTDVVAQENDSAMISMEPGKARASGRASTTGEYKKERAKSHKTTAAPGKAGKERAEASRVVRDATVRSSATTEQHDHPLRSQKRPLATLSVREKLMLAEQEALHASRSIRDESPPEIRMSADFTEDSQSDVEDAQPPEERPTLPVRRNKISGQPRRRKSTLSPDELEQLMLGRMGGR